MTSVNILIAVIERYQRINDFNLLRQQKNKRIVTYYVNQIKNKKLKT